VNPAPALAAAVVAWHNRHPFALRIDAAQVSSFGVVALPFTAPGARPLGKVQLAPAVPRSADGSPVPPADASSVVPTSSPPDNGHVRAPGGLLGAFDEAPIDDLSARDIADFALRHGSETRPGPPGWPQRDLPLAPGAARTVPVVRFVYTAALEVKGEWRRVLLGAGPEPAVLGRRLTSRRRQVAGGAGLLGLALLAGLAGTHWLRWSPSEGSAPPLASAKPAASATAVPADNSTRPAAAAVPPIATAPVKAITAEAPVVGPTTPPASAPLPQAPIRPAISDAEREAARREAATLRQTTPPGRPAGGTPAVATASGPVASPTAAAAAAASDVVYAVVTPETKTRAGSQLRVVLMGAPTTRVMGQPHAEVMQVGQGFRAVLWPFTNRAEAEQAKAALAGRGIPSEVVEL
jgi:hypothetical protein